MSFFLLLSLVNKSQILNSDFLDDNCVGLTLYYILNFLSSIGGSEVKASASSAGNLGSIPGSGRSPGEGNGTPLQYFYLENPMDRGAWEAVVHGITKSRTRLSDFTFTPALQVDFFNN